MRPNSTKKQKPEDMLLRVIRVAEILVKGQDEATGHPSDVDRKPAHIHVDTSTVHVQKTQS